jgi:hypothetical protein
VRLTSLALREFQRARTNFGEGPATRSTYVEFLRDTGPREVVSEGLE